MKFILISALSVLATAVVTRVYLTDSTARAPCFFKTNSGANVLMVPCTDAAKCKIDNKRRFYFQTLKSYAYKDNTIATKIDCANKDITIGKTMTKGNSYTGSGYEMYCY